MSGVVAAPNYVHVRASPIVLWGSHNGKKILHVHVDLHVEVKSGEKCQSCI